MPEEQAFGVLVKIMFEYNLRNFYKDGFHDLHMRFYQLERTLQVNVRSRYSLVVYRLPRGGVVSRYMVRMV